MLSRCRGERGRGFAASFFFFAANSWSTKGLKGSGFPKGLYLYEADGAAGFISVTCAPPAFWSAPIAFAVPIPVVKIRMSAAIYVTELLFFIGLLLTHFFQEHICLYDTGRIDETPPLDVFSFHVYFFDINDARQSGDFLEKQSCILKTACD